MATETAPPVAPPTAPPLSGFKYFDRLLPLLKPLHDAGCDRDRAGNRILHFDHYCQLVLLSMFNPALRSLRALQQASTLKKVQEKIGCPQTSLGSLSESVRVFDPSLLEDIIAALLQELPDRPKTHPDLSHVLTAVDGSVVRTLASLTAAAYLKDKNGQTHCGWRFHTHFEIERGIPVLMDVTSAANGGETSEKQHLRKHLEADRCYVMDRGYAAFGLWNEIVDIGSSYVCRIKDNSDLDTVEEERPVSDDAKKAGVLRDVIVTMGTSSKPALRPKHKVRVVMVQTPPHKKTGGRKGDTAGPPSDGIIRIATNLLQLPAEMIADIYKHRWLIELFFRCFKHLLGCRHLLSQHPGGIQIQAYCAIIACLLMHLWIGGKPTLRTFEMLCLYLQGWASLDELLTHLKKLQQEKKIA